MNHNLILTDLRTLHLHTYKKCNNYIYDLLSFHDMKIFLYFKVTCSSIKEHGKLLCFELLQVPNCLGFLEQRVVLEFEYF